MAGESKPISVIRITLEVIGKERFSNVWEIKDTTLDKAVLAEQILMGAMKSFQDATAK